MYTILLVDDESMERNGIEKLIMKNHYQLKILQAANGVQALELFEKEKIDILLTDIKMPIMSGMELIKEVQKRGWNPVCVIYSAYGEFEYAQNAIALGVLQYLLKPIKVDEFKKLFDKVIEICQEKEEQKAENKELRKKIQNIEEDRLNKQIMHYLDSEDDWNEEIQLFNDSKMVPVMMSSYSYLFSKYWENYEIELRSLFTQNIMIMNKDDTQTLLLVPQESLNGEKEERNRCNQLIDMSQKKYQSELFIIVGNVCSDVTELKCEYRKMQDQLDYQFFISESAYFLNGEYGYQKEKTDMLALYFKKIETCAELEDFASMKQEFVKAFQYVEDRVGFSSIYVKYNFSEIIKRCCEILNNKNVIMGIVEDIYEAKNIEQVKNAVFYLIDTMQQCGENEVAENRIIVMAKNYIQEHYQDFTLSVSAVSDELSISAAYLSTLFKMETKQNIVKYICQYRLEKAKELLLTTNLKVGEVSKKVGYINSSYFISLFKTNTGVSPAQYREREF